MRRSFGLAKLIEDSLSRPAHKPRVARSHLAQEYADLAALAPDVQNGHTNKVIAAELRRTLRGVA